LQQKLVEYIVLLKLANFLLGRLDMQVAIRQFNNACIPSSPMAVYTIINSYSNYEILQNPKAMCGVNTWE